MAMETDYAREYMRKWRAKNREKYRAYQKEYQIKYRMEYMTKCRRMDMESIEKVKERLLKELRLYQRNDGQRPETRWRVGYIDGIEKALKVIEEESK